MDNDIRRVEEIDIIKALGIILMVAGHADAPFKNFIYLFHMAIFFIASGYVFKSTSSNDIFSVMRAVYSKIKKLWVPFIIWSVIYILLHNFFLHINIYTADSHLFEYVSGTNNTLTEAYTFEDIGVSIFKSLNFYCNEQIFGPSWFLRVLFMVSVCYLICDYLIKKITTRYVLNVQILMSCIFLIFGYYCMLNDLYAKGFAQTASYYCLFCIGNVFFSYRKWITKCNWKVYGVILLISFGILCIFNEKGTISLSAHRYETPFFLLGTSLMGWLLLYSLSYFIKFIPFLNKFFLFIGKRTLSILILHLVCMKLVTKIVVISYGLPQCCLAAFPNLYGSKNAWWLAYSLAGIILPLGMECLFEVIQIKVRNVRILGERE